MGLLDKAKKDWKAITSSVSHWAVEMTLTAPNNETAIITNLHTKHHLSVDQFGMPVNSKNAHISFFEDQVYEVNASYPIRNVNGEVSMARHLVSVSDSTGMVKNYVIERWHQDETLGVIICILGNYA